MTIIFDGRAFAKNKENVLQSRIHALKSKNITPTLVSIVVGDTDGAMKYQEMKKKVGERIGIEIEIKPFEEETPMTELLRLIEKLNTDPKVHGIMIQLPLPKSFAFEDRQVLINAIDLKKDVDGMNERSEFIAPVVMAVLNAFQLALNSKFEARNTKQIQNNNDKIQKSLEHLKIEKLDIVSDLEFDASNFIPTVSVVGAEGFEGKKIVKAFQAWGYGVKKLDISKDNAVFINHEISHSDVVVSCTGSPSSIAGEVIKPNAILIDVGAPKGDFDFESVVEKASFITPVPGGIGPVTIVSLMENVVEATSNN